MKASRNEEVLLKDEVAHICIGLAMPKLTAGL
jgi:hypothetical protein